VVRVKYTLSLSHFVPSIFSGSWVGMGEKLDEHLFRFMGGGMGEKLEEHLFRFMGGGWARN
jgi:hypothetical protein